MKTLNWPFGREGWFGTGEAESSELAVARYYRCAQTLPIMHVILIANAWLLGALFVRQAPGWLSLLCPALCTVFCVMRMRAWLLARKADPTLDQVLAALANTSRLSVGLIILQAGWVFALHSYGDAATRSFLFFFVATTTLAVIYCLAHLRVAAIRLAIIANVTLFILCLVSGTAIHLAATMSLLVDSIGGLVVLTSTYRDFSKTVNARAEEQRRAKEQELLLRMIDNMPVAVMTVEPQTYIINYANQMSKVLIRSIEHLLPIRADDLIGTSIDVFHRSPAHQRGILADPNNLPHNARIRLGDEVLDLKISAITAMDGHYMAPMLTWALVTKEVEAENRIRHLAHYDALTELPNRVTFRRELEDRLATPGNRVGLLYIDLDGFKLVNDTRGHQIGDALLQQVAARLKMVCNGPAVTLTRLGGDEFAVLLPHDSRPQALLLADLIVTALGAPFDLDYDRTIRIGASVGIALAPEHGGEPDILLSRADMALYAAKEAGRGTARLFSPDLEKQVQERVRLEEELRSALASGDGVFVFYQPIVDLPSGRVTSREALARWHHPEQGWISPGLFVPVAEQCGLIDQLGAFILDRACRSAAQWADEAHVAVNVSAMQLGKGTLVDLVSATLAASGLPAERLEIEVTETALLGDEQRGIQELLSLREMGVRISLDDFGTGYSSLAHLRTFAFDKIKIDGSFVRDALERPECAAVVRAIADLGQRLGVRIVAEGVETEDQLALVRAEGCREVQGYLYGRPAPGEADALLIAGLDSRR
ncbi:MAG: EAL domain-containing protein [Gluconacetobacter sp.]|uniref:EAL domain-containing protein n=1 Tax=Gluconacetobacter dulcium TaxID=2729096 RepID=A0A7W4JYP7_9PROT|nr:EAL domain-containing protein [Gluconacetobacter dulcium]MBB2197164.1 EAL domain-containing protein [Gluconacetobacter dulcium]